jgi:hypothetical protein
MALDLDDGYRAGRLLHWGLQPRQRPAQEPEYRDLIDQYLDRGDFRELVQTIASGLQLRVLDAGDYGIALGPEGNSAFALRHADFRPGTSSAEDRLIDGLVQLAVAATVFPNSRDLKDEATRARPAVTVDEIEDNLRRLAKRLEQESKQAPDPKTTAEEAGFYEAWRVYQSRLAAVETSDNRQSRRATRRSIQFALDRLSEFGCFLRETRGSHVYYQPTCRYQVQVKELAALHIYARLCEALGTGSEGDES